MNIRVLCYGVTYGSCYDSDLSHVAVSVSLKYTQYKYDSVKVYVSLSLSVTFEMFKFGSNMF